MGKRHVRRAEGGKWMLMVGVFVSQPETVEAVQEREMEMPRSNQRVKSSPLFRRGKIPPGVFSRRTRPDFFVLINRPSMIVNCTEYWPLTSFIACIYQATDSLRKPGDEGEKTIRRRAFNQYHYLFVHSFFYHLYQSSNALDHFRNLIPTFSPRGFRRKPSLVFKGPSCSI